MHRELGLALTCKPRLLAYLYGVSGVCYQSPTGRPYQNSNALYLDSNFAAQTIAPEINKTSGVVKFKRVVEAPSKLDWNSIFTYRTWRLRCNGPSEPNYNLWSYGVIRSYGYNDVECSIIPLAPSLSKLEK